MMIFEVYTTPVHGITNRAHANLGTASIHLVRELFACQYFASLQGWLLHLIYGIDKRVRESLTERWSIDRRNGSSILL